MNTQNLLTTTDSSPSSPLFRILKFGGLSCPACIALKKARTLERFAEAHPGVKIVELDINDRDGEVPPGTEFEKNYKLSDTLNVEAIPTVIFQTRDGGEILRFEGNVNLKTLEKAYAEALASVQAFNAIPW